MKKSSDETPGAQSLFLNNTEHSAALAKSQVTEGLCVFNIRHSVHLVKLKPMIKRSIQNKTFYTKNMTS